MLNEVLIFFYFRWHQSVIERI